MAKMATPTISPLSMSVWMNPQNQTEWFWSVHQGEQIAAKGVASSPSYAVTQATQALFGCVNQHHQMQNQPLR